MHRSRSLCGLMAVAALVAACGSTGPTPVASSAPASSEVASMAPVASTAAAATMAPTASATEAPSLTATAPADVSAAFNAAISDPMWSPHITVQAVSTIGSATVPMTGTIDVTPGTTHTVITSGQGSTSVTEETISSGSTKYTRQYGAWFKSTTVDTSGLGTLVTGTKGFTDAGVEAKGGQQLHHLVLPTGSAVPTAGLGIPATATAAQAAIEAWADAQGNPVVIDVAASWNQVAKTATVPVTVAMELTVAGGAQTISLPTDDDLWAWKTSSVNHYTVAYPITWEYTKGTSKKADYFDGYDGSFLGVTRFSAQKLSLNAVTTYIRGHLASWSGLTSAHLIKVSAAKLGGVSARLVQLRGTYKGVTKYHYDIVAVKGAYVFEMVLSVPRKPTADDLAMWATFLATYKMK